MQQLHIITNKLRLPMAERLSAVMLTMLLLILQPQGVHAWHSRYTKERPLVVACNWELPPYEFSNDKGKPDGYDVELISNILDGLNIPYEIKMKESSIVFRMFEEHKADLIVDPTSRYDTLPYHRSRTILNYYRVQAAVNINRQEAVDLSGFNPATSIILKAYDEATINVLKHYAPNLPFASLPVNEAMTDAANSKERCFLWSDKSLQWCVNKMNLTQVKIVGTSIPAYEMHFAGLDKELINEIDDQYARLEQSGKLKHIYNKWFHPEYTFNDTSPAAIYISLVVLLAVVVLLLLNRLAKNRATQATRRKLDVERMMLQALSMSNYVSIEYDGTSGRFFNKHGHMIPDEGATRQEIHEHIHPEERSRLRTLLAQMLSGITTSAELDLRWLPYGKELPANGSIDSAEWENLRGHIIAETDVSRHARRIICTVKIVSEEVRQEQENSQMASRYSNIFETSVVAMSFYTKDGWLIDINRQMCELCNIDGPAEKFFRESNLFDTPYFHDDYAPGSRHEFHVCQHMHYADLNLDRFLEIRIKPILEDDGELAYYTVTVRDITDERNISMEQRRHDNELQSAYSQISTYEAQLHYLLEHSEMWVWISDVASKKIVFTRSLSQEDFAVSFDEFLEGLLPEKREEALQAFGYLEGVDRNFNATFEFHASPIGHCHQWLSSSGIPLYRKDGSVKGHFGIVRDVTRLMQTQAKLKEESRRADESGKLKSVFLANMTHEIRTPLNAIVGFSDLLQMIDDQNDRREFIRIIRNNCDMLLRLIDDIIEASNMNQGPIAINSQEVDFAVAFNDICQTLAQRVQEPGVQFIVDNPYQQFVTCLDKGRMQQVITNFTTNAVKYTHQGHIKVGWRYAERTKAGTTDDTTAQKGIYMYCEDTGTGIPKEKQASVFERFVKLNDYVQGTGLGLSICKSIAERCGGQIGVDSEGEGHGSTFWIWIPCERKNNNDLTQ